MGDRAMTPPSLDGATSRVISMSTQIMIAATIVIFFVVAFCVFIHLYTKWHWSRYEDPTTASWRRRATRRAPPGLASVQRRGLDPAALRLLPVVVYNPKDFKDGLECAVCLSEVSEGEKARILPKCNHGFHVDCIDMWFQSHSTCPLCRNPVVSSENPSNIPSDNHHNNVNELQEISVSSSLSHSENDNDNDDDGSSSYASARSTEVPVFPTNVLFWGDETQVTNTNTTYAASTSASSPSDIGVGRPRDELVIEIPRDLCEDCLFSSPSGVRFSEEEAKSPVVTRLRSLKRLLSRGKRVVSPSPCETSSGDVEQVQT